MDICKNFDWSEPDYNESGLRTSKIVNGTQTQFIWSGDRLVAELGPSRSFYFHYDAAGEMTGYTYKAGITTIECLFVKNLQGDVERVISDTGTLLASYTYDAWGSICQSSGSLANINPIRYRSYYYDPETGLYYLQSRYYDPMIGRFVNADGQIASLEIHNFSNLFIYCNDSPVNYYDKEGTSPLPYPGLIHQAVLYDIKRNHPTYEIEKMILLNNGRFGRADVISDDGRVWEVKSTGALSTKRKIMKAQNQLNSYVNGYYCLNNNPVSLKAGGVGIQGEFKLYTRYVNYNVSYASDCNGIITYSYMYEMVSEQVLSDIGEVLNWGMTAVVLIVTGNYLSHDGYITQGV